VCYDADMTRDGRLLVTTSWDNTVRFWSLKTGRLLARPLRHPDWVFGCCLSRSGKQVLTACRDGKARLWDWRRRKLVSPPFKHRDAVFTAVFTPDERCVVTAGRDRTVRPWERHTGKPVAEPLGCGGDVWNALVSADGRYVVAAGLFPYLLRMDLSDAGGSAGLSPRDLCLWGEILSGHRLQGGDLEGLTTREWLTRWDRFCRRRHPAAYAARLARAVPLTNPLAGPRRTQWGIFFLAPGLAVARPPVSHASTPARLTA
jgi:hypothetical protein